MFMKSSLSKVLLVVFLLATAYTASAGDIQTLFQKQFDASSSSIVESKALTSQDNHAIESIAIEAIGIERTACFGTCPAYSFIVQTDGSFKYVGENYVDHIGEYTGVIPTFRLKKVLQAIDALDFAALASQYTSNITDMPAVYTLVVQDGESKVIENYAGVGPAHLWAIEELIDSLVEQINWDEAVSADSY